MSFQKTDSYLPIHRSSNAKRCWSLALEVAPVAALSLSTSAEAQNRLAAAG